MPTSPVSDESSEPRVSGWITLDGSGHYLSADEAALALLGVTLEELRQAPPGSFSAEPPDEEGAQALRDEWERTGRQTLAGTANLKRPDGTSLSVTFLIEPQADGTLLAGIQPVAGGERHARKVYTIAEVLRAWRTAERELQEVAVGTPEWTELVTEVEELRSEYQRLFARGQRPEGRR